MEPYRTVHERTCGKNTIPCIELEDEFMTSFGAQLEGEVKMERCKQTSMKCSSYNNAQLFCKGKLVPLLAVHDHHRRNCGIGAINNRFRVYKFAAGVGGILDLDDHKIFILWTPNGLITHRMVTRRWTHGVWSRVVHVVRVSYYDVAQ